MAWAWVKPKSRSDIRSYVKIRPTGLYISMRAEEVPWPRRRVRVEVGFEPGRMAIRLSEDGRSVTPAYTSRRWGGNAFWAGLDELAREDDLPVGGPLPARYDAKQDVVVVEPQGTGL